MRHAPKRTKRAQHAGKLPAWQLMSIVALNLAIGALLATVTPLGPLGGGLVMTAITLPIVIWLVLRRMKATECPDDPAHHQRHPDN